MVIGQHQYRSPGFFVLHFDTLLDDIEILIGLLLLKTGGSYLLAVFLGTAIEDRHFGTVEFYDAVVDA